MIKHCSEHSNYIKKLMRLFHIIGTPVGLLVLFLTFLTCLSPIDINPSDFEDFVVVQGFIDDDFGPHEIRITNVAQFSGTATGGNVTIIDGATVKIIDQNGVETPLRRLSLERKELILPDPPYPTVPCTPWLSFANIKTDYLTPETFKGEIGNAYTLEILTREGKRYRSEPQTIRPTPEIDSLILAFKEIPGLDPIVPESGVEIFTSFNDPAEEDNYYFWRVNGIYRIFTRDRSTFDFCCAYDPRDGGEENCWIVEENIEGNLLAFSDQRVNGQQVTQSIGFLKDDGIRFANTAVPSSKQYYVEVEQYAIDIKAFNFNERVVTLGSINGEIFDPPPLSVRGNVFNVDDPDETVIGYFGAYSVQKKGVFVKRSLFNFIQNNPRPCGDCRLRSGAQVEIPEPYRD